jgi:hypothetical protein
MRAQVQEAVKLLQLPQAPHVVAPICEAGSSSMALRYLDKLTEQQQGLQEQQQKAGAVRKQAGATSVLKPEFLIFRNITSAVVAQVRTQEQSTVEHISRCGARQQRQHRIQGASKNMAPCCQLSVAEEPANQLHWLATCSWELRSPVYLVPSALEG